MRSETGRSPSDAQVTVLEPLTAEIIEALRYFQGVCHRNQVVEYITAGHLQRGLRAGSELATAILAAFERHLGAGQEDPRPFRLPFGPGSHRWGLSERAMRGQA